MAASFPNTRMAIQVLRQGKKDQRWFSAAEYLIEKASPEVLLMLEVGREMQIHEVQQKKARNSKNWRPIVLKTLAAILLIVVASGLTLMLLKNLPICPT